MIAIEIIPLSGIEIEHIGRLNLGFSKTAVEALLGPPPNHPMQRNCIMIKQCNCITINMS